MPSKSRALPSNLGPTLEDVLRRTDRVGRRARDPVEFAHGYADAADREVVALLAASLAFGNVRTIRDKVGDALRRLGPSPAKTADDPAKTRRALHGWVHRVYRGDDVAMLLVGARAVQRAHGSLGAHFAQLYAEKRDLRETLGAFVEALRAHAGPLFDPARRGAIHILPDPRGASACKRLMLFLRWMIRPADGIDLGLWTERVSPSILLIPVDVHIHRLSRNVGLTARNDLSWRTAEEITSGLRTLDPADPVRFDFALCHLGMVQRCPSKKDPVRCEGCGVMPLCRHWRAKGLDRKPKSMRR